MQREAQARLGRVAQLSDAHLSPRVPGFGANFALAAAAVRAAAPDLLVATGDLSLDGAGTPGELAAARDAHAGLAPDWVAVPGNHDVGDGPAQPVTPARLAAWEAAFGPRTRFVVLNNPINPTGTVLPPEDLALLAEVCIAHDAVAICDEVWEQVIFERARHVPLIALPGMRERTVKIGSAGKMFGLTGWKVGFLCAGAELTRALSRTHQFLTFTTPPNLQAAVAWGLSRGDGWFEEMPAGLQRSRDRLAEGLRREGFVPLPAQGTYFLNIDLLASGVTEDDRSFALRAVREAGVATIPVSAFYEQDHVRTILRLCLAKADATLDEGVARLARARELSRGG